LSSHAKKREPLSILKTLLALILIALCVWAAQWQYHRGVDRHARNSFIEVNSAKDSVPLIDVAGNPAQFEWQPVRVAGRFDPATQILLRNRYYEGVYGFELLTRFTSKDGQKFWIDRGWVKAGASATIRPELPAITSDSVEIIGRLRLDSSLPRGSFFAIPTNSSEGLIKKANAQSGTESEKFYLDLMSGSIPELTPAVAAELPELSDGPHMAYALQWVFFASLVIYGRILIRRDVLSIKEL